MSEAKEPKSSVLVRGLLALPRPAKRMIALGVDASICAFTVYLAFYLRLGELVNPFVGPPHPTMGAIALALPIFVSMGLYRAIFRHAGYNALGTIARAVAIYTVPYVMIYSVIGVYGVPRTIGIIQPVLLFLFVAASRLLARNYLGETYSALWKGEDVQCVLIYGAGRSGRQLASAIRGSGEMRLVGMIDDDRDLWGSTVDGIHVYDPAELDAVVRKRKVTDILLAIPSATRARRGEIVAQLRELNLHVRTLPGLVDLARGSVSVTDLRDLEIDDLLGRAAVPPNGALLKRNIAGKVVLVTGAGGSIGSELCRQIVLQEPERLVLVDNSEFNLYAIHREITLLLESRGRPTDGVVPIIGSVSNGQRMHEVLSCFAPDTVFHAAAYKHVPLVEHNAVEGIGNNVFGTLTLARAAQRAGVRNFVLISTDKAVRPTNIMGTSKRLAEMVLQALDHEGGETRFSMVRFGNVLGSSGSVVPLFRDQIAAGGPITITHPDITRYFMTIPEAAQLVIQAGAMAAGGDVFVLNMGEPVKIVDLARNMVELSGLTLREPGNPQGDIEVQFVGLRPAEKLYEELLIGADSMETEHQRILRANENFLPWSRLEPSLAKLKSLLDEGDASGARESIRELVPEFQPSSPLVDYISVSWSGNPANGTGSAAEGSASAIGPAIGADLTDAGERRSTAPVK